MKPAQWHVLYKAGDDSAEESDYMYGCELDHKDIIMEGDKISGHSKWHDAILSLGHKAGEMPFKIVRPVGVTIAGGIAA